MVAQVGLGPRRADLGGPALERGSGPQVLRTLLNKTDFHLPSIVGPLQPTPHATQRAQRCPFESPQASCRFCLESSEDNSSGLDLGYY